MLELFFLNDSMQEADKEIGLPNDTPGSYFADYVAQLLAAACMAAI